jgi:hypothetical protein
VNVGTRVGQKLVAGTGALEKTAQLIGIIVGDCMVANMGLFVGIFVGLKVGRTVGSALGIIVGTIVGLKLGRALGPMLGNTVGKHVGPTVGAIIGILVGSDTGILVGRVIGILVGLFVRTSLTRAFCLARIGLIVLTGPAVGTISSFTGEIVVRTGLLITGFLVITGIAVESTSSLTGVFVLERRIRRTGIVIGTTSSLTGGFVLKIGLASSFPETGCLRLGIGDLIIIGFLGFTFVRINIGLDVGSSLTEFICLIGFETLLTGT